MSDYDPAYGDGPQEPPREVEPERKCRACGCTDDNACTMKSPTYPGNIVSCWWVDLDAGHKHGGPLCSACVNPEVADMAEVPS